MRTTKYTINRNLYQRKGFTLVEILVVLAIASLLAAVTLGGYNAMSKSNKRTSCQANMSQIYHAIRLYAADYDGAAPYSDNGDGIGLWALYGFADDDGDMIVDPNVKPEQRYIKKPKLFHCPADSRDDSGQLEEDGSYNSDFLSYQVEDEDSDDQFTYSAVRTDNISDPAWQRQLLHYDENEFISRPPTDDTVVFWCPFHRNNSGEGEDNVLFWDGSVQSIPRDQDGRIGWERLPKGDE